MSEKCIICESATGKGEYILCPNIFGEGGPWLHSIDQLVWAIKTEYFGDFEDEMNEFGIYDEVLLGIVTRAQGIEPGETRLLFENDKGDEISLSYEFIPESELSREWQGF